jgi:hypothetical protein
MADDDAAFTELLAGYTQLLEAMRMLTILSERPLERAAGQRPLTAHKADVTRQELDTTHGRS